MSTPKERKFVLPDIPVDMSLPPGTRSMSRSAAAPLDLPAYIASCRSMALSDDSNLVANHTIPVGSAFTPNQLVLSNITMRPSTRNTVISPVTSSQASHCVRQNTSVLSLPIPEVPMTLGPDGTGSVKYPPPDPNSFVLDPLTGYQFDAKTGLHYDANSGYFFNNTLKIVLSWDFFKETYLRVEYPLITFPILRNQIKSFDNQRGTPSPSQSPPHNRRRSREIRRKDEHLISESSNRLSVSPISSSKKTDHRRSSGSRNERRRPRSPQEDHPPLSSLCASARKRRSPNRSSDSKIRHPASRPRLRRRSCPYSRSPSPGHSCRSRSPDKYRRHRVPKSPTRRYTDSKKEDFRWRSTSPDTNVSPSPLVPLIFVPPKSKWESDEEQSRSPRIMSPSDDAHSKKGEQKARSFSRWHHVSTNDKSSDDDARSCNRDSYKSTVKVESRRDVGFTEETLSKSRSPDNKRRRSGSQNQIGSSYRRSVSPVSFSRKRNGRRKSSGSDNGKRRHLSPQTDSSGSSPFPSSRKRLSRSPDSKRRRPAPLSRRSWQSRSKSPSPSPGPSSRRRGYRNRSRSSGNNRRHRVSRSPSRRSRTWGSIDRKEEQRQRRSTTPDSENSPSLSVLLGSEGSEETNSVHDLPVLPEFVVKDNVGDEKGGGGELMEEWLEILLADDGDCNSMNRKDEPISEQVEVQRRGSSCPSGVPLADQDHKTKTVSSRPCNPQNAKVTPDILRNREDSVKVVDLTSDSDKIQPSLKTQDCGTGSVSQDRVSCDVDPLSDLYQDLDLDCQPPGDTHSQYQSCQGNLKPLDPSPNVHNTQNNREKIVNVVDLTSDDEGIQPDLKIQDSAADSVADDRVPGHTDPFSDLYHKAPTCFVHVKPSSFVRLADEKLLKQYLLMNNVEFKTVTRYSQNSIGCSFEFFEVTFKYITKAAEWLNKTNRKVRFQYAEGVTSDDYFLYFAERCWDCKNCDMATNIFFRTLCHNCYCHRNGFFTSVKFADAPTRLLAFCKMPYSTDVKNVMERLPSAVQTSNFISVGIVEDPYEICCSGVVIVEMPDVQQALSILKMASLTPEVLRFVTEMATRSAVTIFRHGNHVDCRSEFHYPDPCVDSLHDFVTPPELPPHARYIQTNYAEFGVQPQDVPCYERYVVPDEICVEPDEIHVEPDEIHVEPDEIHVEPDEVLVEPDEIHVEPDEICVEPEEIYVDPDEIYVQPDLNTNPPLRNNHQNRVLGDPDPMSDLYPSEPTCVVHVKSSGQRYDKSVISASLQAHLFDNGIKFLDISVMCLNEHGCPYHLVEVTFESTAAAEQWFLKTNRRITLRRTLDITADHFLYYRGGPPWHCQNCHSFNIFFRSLCHGCLGNREGLYTTVTFSEPETRFLAFCRMAYLTDVTNVMQLLPMKKIRQCRYMSIGIVEDPAMKCSVGIVVVELPNIEEVKLVKHKVACIPNVVLRYVNPVIDSKVVFHPFDFFPSQYHPRSLPIPAPSPQPPSQSVVPVPPSTVTTFNLGNKKRNKKMKKKN